MSEGERLESPRTSVIFNVEDAEENFPSIRNFESIKLNTHCSYAAGSRLWGSPPFDKSLPFRSNLANIASHCAYFVSLSQILKLDGYVIELPDLKYGENIEALGGSLHAVLHYLAEFDPAGSRGMDGPIEDPAWCFAFGGEKIFVNVFAPCYPEHHSRYGFGSSSTFIVLQPRHTFAPAIRPGDSALSPAIRQRIRHIFDVNNRSYDGGLSMVPFEAYRCIRPIRVGEPVVRWWETSLDGF
ncbi:hypothetical protein BUMB_03330c [Candidatus Paraburkholderia calva]|nr:hypothetical protein BUMB_03330c [Candidatus Paraburkholderia calva]